MLKTPKKIRELQSELRQSAKHIYVKKMIGKPCAGKPHARFEVAGDGKVLWRT
jgi:hypothetical protein